MRRLLLILKNTLTVGHGLRHNWGLKMKNDDMRKMIKMENLVPIILGVALSGLGTLMNFAYSNIEELHSEVVEHRLLLSRLISPDGKLIQSPTSAASKTAINKEISDLKRDIAVLQTKMDYINPD